MKKISIIIFFAITIIGHSQEKSSTFSLVEVILAAGISSPTSTFSDNSYAANGSFIELSADYYFSKLGAGISVGNFSNETEGNLMKITEGIDAPLVINSEKWKTSYFGIGPSYKANFGNFETTISGRVGSMQVKPINLEGSLNVENADTPTTIPIYNISHKETSSMGFYNAGIKLGYKLNPSLSLHISANYLSSFSEDLSIEEIKTNIQNFDLDRDGILSQEEIIDLQGVTIDYESSTISSSLQTLNFGFGISYNFGKRPNKTRESDMNAAGSHTNPYFVSNELVGDMLTMNSGSVTFTNPAKKDEKRQQKIIGVLPKNNSVFKNTDELAKFTWEIVGAKIAAPQFIIEVTKIGSNQQPASTYIEKTSKTNLGATRIFKENNISDGRYRWRVIETTTGNSSDVKYFTFSNCEIDFSISNEEIECLGYEGEDRKYKICFDSTYSSSSGDLTFTDPGSGLSVFDQTYAALTYTLVSPNPTLLPQVGASTSTVSYCFEVIVPASVIAIGFGLQGDDLDPSPVLCQPGVSASFDELPDCICDDCEDIELSFDNFNISLNGTSGNQFNFDGDINVNVPIYGIEFQIQSYTYSATPSACSEGVSSVEESGVILMPGTTINGSTSLQLVNETASGSASSNNNATKNIKYTSNSPLTGAIPVNLTVGLPGPISGLDPSCCEINYTVCIKVKVFYEESNCKSCVFTHCFNFNNQ